MTPTQSWFVQWATVDKFTIVNTFCNQDMHDRWTHTGVGGLRQIDFILLDQHARKWMKDARATDLIGIGKDHRGVKLNLEFTTTRRERTQRGGQMKGWQPANKKEYAEELDKALAKATPNATLSNK